MGVLVIREGTARLACLPVDSERDGLVPGHGSQQFKNSDIAQRTLATCSDSILLH